jgi:hypothetical protein
MSIIIPANSAVGGGFAVDNSCRFNDDDSQSMTKASTTVTNDVKFTISAWCKRSTLNGSGEFGIFGYVANDNNGNSNLQFGFKNDSFYCAFISNNGSNTHINKVTNAVYRDTSAWYNVMLAVDSSQGTAGNRARLYVNGTEITSFSTDTNPANGRTFLNDACNINVGRYTTTGGTQKYFDGYLAEVVFIDGQQLTPTSFGEFDEDSGIWKPLESVADLTFGNNGFYLDFEDSANLGNDANGGTDLTEANLTAVDQTTDTCTNNFATGNILSPYANRTISDGSLTITSTTTQWTNICSTIGVSSGKWWIELKHTTGSYGGLGIVSPFPQTENNVIGDFSAPVIQQIGYVAASGDKKINNSTSSYGSTWVGTGDIVNMSLNLDDNELKFYKNGAVQDSGTAIAISSGYTYFVGTSNYNSSGSSFNFGNPAFSISSGNADANGYGNFEYAPPAGFLALCTANLSEVLS